MRNRRKLLVAAAAIAVLLMAGAAVAYFTIVKTPGDISNPDVPFLAPAPTPAPKTAQKPAKPANFRWPNYGYTKDHRRAFDPPKPLRGPWRTKWKHKASALTEFPPSIAQNRILQLSDDARLVSRNLETGKKIWDRKLGRLSASSPAIEDGRVYVTLLNGAQGSGRVVCLRFGDGKILWSKALSSRSESSPLVDSGRVFFGSEGGTLYALDAKSGKQDWTYRAGGAVKGSPTLSDGVLFFGAYGGSVHAVRARDGAKVWTSGAGHGLVRSGNFYATAAVAFGRVYIGATDGRAYSFSAKDGRVAWAHQTGRYVYSSAAVKDVPGAGPMVFFGSYDGTFYALDARSGKVRWTHSSGGKISGSPTIVGDTVYFADLGRAITLGLKARGGKVVFQYPIGAYDPIISDGERLYLTGNRSLSSLEPRRAYEKRQKAKEAKAKNKKARADLLVSPAWPERCRQLAPCGPLTAVRERRAKVRG